ncbi:MAG TPA: methyl-accepting chemotaxis protein [Novimethylophilus sp.]|uniref:methyl-accepting chemotaxis protein n=1 Tax=Novimethylophilus sp. TaxID=2137426 RepID=UPI002F411671
MKINQPVTNREKEMRDDTTIVTMTDLKGTVTYANEDFCEISGFSATELVGENHNIVRHPDMPPEAFADLWSTLKKGKPWNGIVKNRCKNGDHYWVNAYVAPIEDNGQVAGYASVRTKPGRAQVETADRLYREMRDGTAKVRLHEGRLAPKSLMARLNPARIVGSLDVGRQLNLLTGIFLLGLILAGLVAFGTFDKVQINGPVYKRIVQGKDLVADILPPPEYLIESWLTALEMTTASPSDLPALVEKSRRLLADYEDRHKFWMRDLPEGKLKTLMVENSYKPGKAFLDLQSRQFIPALQAGNREAAMALIPALRARYAEHRAMIDEAVKLANDRNAEDERAAAATIRSGSRLLLMICLGLAAIVGVLGWAIAGNLRRMLGGDPRYAADIARHLANGNLMVRIDAAEGGDSLLGAIRHLQQSLKNLVGHIRGVAEQVASNAQQSAAAADQVSSASQQQSAAVEATAAATEQITVSVGQVAENARQAEATSTASGDACVTGSAVIHDAVESMEQIAATVRDASQTVLTLGKQSEQISSVVQVIREIADQTNLLALNAAIEAARAGEQGRGFAVVADEVRKLAERTTQATHEIAQMIGSVQSGMQTAVARMENGVQQVDRGVAQANEAGETINRIREDALRVAQAVAEISVALREQNTASEDIAKRVEQIAQVSEENSLAAGHSSEGARHLLANATQLRKAVARFMV